MVLEEKSRLQAKTNQKSANFSEKAVLKPQSSQNSRQNCSELATFLRNHNLSQYYQLLLSKGFEEIEILREITAEMLNEMQIPPGHQIKLMKALRKDAKIEEKPDITRKICSSSVAKRTDLVELPLEIEETRAFSQKTAAKAVKKVNFSQNIKENTKIDEGTGTSPRNFEANARKPAKISCWNCFKLFESCDFCEYAKSFCSEACRDAFLRTNELVCAKCAKKKLKTQGIHRNSQFFCDEACAPNFEELRNRWNCEAKEEFLQKERQIIKENCENFEENAEKSKEIVDLFEDLKVLSGKSAENTHVFLSLQEIEEKYLRK